jgi:hypothetical protein
MTSVRTPTSVSFVHGLAVAVQRHPDRSHEKDDDVAFRSATVLLLPVCRDHYRCNEHLARCRGALLALSGM